jgi:hypothetical protein
MWKVFLFDKRMQEEEEDGLCKYFLIHKEAFACA